jgi:hypothetical protein
MDNYARYLRVHRSVLLRTALYYLGSKKLDPQYISISNKLLYVTAWQRIKPESCAYNAGCIIVYGTDGAAQRFIDTDAQSYLNLSVPEGKTLAQQERLDRAVSCQGSSAIVRIN